MSDFIQALLILCIFLSFIFTVYISYKLKFKFENSKDLKNLKDEISVDLDLNKKE